jgi:DNA repair protein RecO (recombination protein O)
MPSRERSIRVEALVLRHTDWGEADRILSLYTRQMGKVGAIAKGVRKMKSRKAGHLEPFTRVNLQLARGRGLFIVTQAEAINPHLNLRENLELLGYASYIVELLDRFTYDEDENPSLYRLLVQTLPRIDQGPDPLLAVRYYEVRLLDLLGYRPKMFQCANCENEIKPEDQYFSALQGGVLCPKCGSGAADARPISMIALKYLRHFQRSSYSQARKAVISGSVNREIEQVVQYYLTYLLERGLNTPSFLKHVKGST